MPLQVRPKPQPTAMPTATATQPLSQPPAPLPLVPVQEPVKAPWLEPRSWLEHSLITPLAQLRSLPEDPQRPLLTYGEVIELRFVECGMMLSVDLDYEGLAYASWGRQHHRTQHDIRFHAPGRPKRRGLARVLWRRAGAEVQGLEGSMVHSQPLPSTPSTLAPPTLTLPASLHRHRLGVSNTRDLDAKARKLCKQAGESVVLVAQWGERHTTDKQLFRLRGFCDLRGVPLRAGDKFYLRALGPQAGCPDGVHLNADWEVPWQERQVRVCGDAQQPSQAAPSQAKPSSSSQPAAAAKQQPNSQAKHRRHLLPLTHLPTLPPSLPLSSTGWRTEARARRHARAGGVQGRPDAPVAAAESRGA